MKIHILLIISLFALSSCIGQRIEKQAQKDKELIENYISEKELEAESTENGLYFVTNEIGAGDHPRSTSTVTVAYKGYFPDGEVFDESSDEGATFRLDQVIEGWTEGIPKFKEGGKGILLIPSKLGYGSSSRAGIPANSVLIFDVHLIKIDQY